MLKTYHDGVGVERCEVCHAPLRSKTGQLLVPVAVSDLERVALLLGEVVKHLEEMCGRTVAQLEQVQRQSAPLE